MKIKKACLFLLSTLILVLFPITIKVNAINTGLQTDEISSEEKDSFIASIDISVISEEPPRKDITCFDVNSNHLIAIAQNTFNSSKQTVCIYSNEGVFQYGYTFDYSATYRLEWDEENINIYFVRGGTLISITPSGEVLDILDVPVTVENSVYSNKVLDSFKRTVDGTEYSIKNDMGILRIFCSPASFSKVIVKDSNGNESIIYDVNSMLLKKAIIILSLLGVLILVSLVEIIKLHNKQKRNN